MTDVLQRELNNLIRVSDQTRPLLDYDGIYFTSCDSASFYSRASSIANRLENFKGVVIDKLSARSRFDISFGLNTSKNFQFFEWRDFFKLNKKRILLVDFKDSQNGVQFGNFASELGYEAIDYLKCMNDLAMVHTYLPVNKERELIIDNIDKYTELIDWLTDPLSKMTVIARIKTLITSNRRFLFDVTCPNNIFTRNEKSFTALHIDSNESYIDIGAAHGDTVTQFYTASGGRYESITAFEPDSVNYQYLNLLGESLPNTSCHCAGLSNQNNVIPFYETPENRFGSRFDKNGSKNLPYREVNVVKLDDIIERATILKIDVEGHECKVLEGGQAIIKDQKPSMYISGYHFPQDLINIVDLVRNIYSYENVAIRHFSHNIYDTNILFSTKQSFLPQWSINSVFV